MRLTISSIGRIPAHVDEEPFARLAELRCLMATRAQINEQRAFALLLHRLFLVAGSIIFLPPCQ